MSGTREGGLKAAKTMKSKYGNDYYKRLAALGGSVESSIKGYGSTKVGKDGFTGPERAQILGSLAGALSRRAHYEKKIGGTQGQ